MLYRYHIVAGIIDVLVDPYVHNISEEIEFEHMDALAEYLSVYRCNNLGA